MSGPATGRRTPGQQLGHRAEERAEEYLRERGLRIVARNYRTRMGEIDLIATEGDALVFVEVRLRSSERFGGAAASVDERKQRRVVAAARHYLSTLRVEPPCRFDVVTLDGVRTTWFKAAFDAA
jgi:putative endonuclease